MKAQASAGEHRRLSELRSFDILDTGTEAEFDDVVQLAARICDAPVALISLVDSDRQWFKARVGLEPSETPLDQSICAHAILGDDILEIPDASVDVRTADNPLCSGEKDRFRYYAGAPMVTATGQKVGTLCILDRVPRALGDLQRDTLRILARQIVRQLELRRALRHEAILRDEIDHRVKNSLQTVLSFVRIYTMRMKSPEAKEALDAISRRVSAIAQLHLELYQTEAVETVRLEQYLERVIQLLRGQAPRHVTITGDLVDFDLSVDVATSVAMIVSEFCANAFKHAFPDGRPGEIGIVAARTETGLRLTCRDNGIGDTEAPFEVSDIVSIGTTLMRTAADQIGGRLEVEATPEGYVLDLDIPVKGARNATPEAAPSAG